MKKLLFTILTTSALTASLFAAQNEKFTGKDNWITGGAVFTIKPSATFSIANTASAPEVCRSFFLGTVFTGVNDSITASTNMKIAPHTLVAPEGATLASGILTFNVARNITITQTDVGSTDARVPFLITGTDINGAAITESITPGNTTVLTAGVKAFKTVSSIVSSAWVVNATGTSTADTVKIGTGDIYGLPVAPAASGYALTISDATAAGSVIITNSAISNCTVAVTVASGAGRKLTVFLTR